MLDILFLIIIFLLVFILLIPFVLGSIGMGILRFFSRGFQDDKGKKKKSRSGFTTSGKSGNSANKQGHQKVFADDEGTYVDFEEV